MEGLFAHGETPKKAPPIRLFMRTPDVEADTEGEPLHRIGHRYRADSDPIIHLARHVVGDLSEEDFRRFEIVVHRAPRDAGRLG